jgi:outer membrane lipoprotein-sorting protein
MRRAIFFAAALLASVVHPAVSQSFPEGEVDAYIEAADALVLPLNCKARMSITDYYGGGQEKSSEGFFIRKDNKVVFVNTAPASQKNFALLRNEDLFYQRFANTNKVVKTSATASSRGGETSNLDLTRFNTTLDYTVAYLGRESAEGKDCYKFELKARNRKLAYGLVHAWIEVSSRLPVKRSFFAVAGKELKYYRVRSVTLKGGRAAAMEIEYVDALKPEERSQLRIFDVTPLKNVPEPFFTKEYLESGRLYPYDF